MVTCILLVDKCAQKLKHAYIGMYAAIATYKTIGELCTVATYVATKAIF